MLLCFKQFMLRDDKSKVQRSAKFKVKTLHLVVLRITIGIGLCSSQNLYPLTLSPKFHPDFSLILLSGFVIKWIFRA